MSTFRTPEFLRSLPSVDEVLAHAGLADARTRHPHLPWTRLVRAVVEEARAGSGVGLPEQPDRAALILWTVARVRERCDALRTGGIKPVLNGTGVLLHTNLGRAPVGQAAADAALRALRGYVSLEVDLATGERAKRGTTVEELLCLATGAEAAMVVNNNAAAIYLVANAFSPPGRIIVSRGELVEIGGSFRLPEILRHAADSVVEVGTTNRTYAADYERVARPGDLILKVHKSNYSIEGFAHEASVPELVDVARARSCTLVHDLGSGAFFDYAAHGVGNEPVAAAEVATGVDGITMSGDKLMGGVQAGIVLGTHTLIGRLKGNPLRRAVRVDKVALAALQEVLRGYLFGAGPVAAVPVVARVVGGVEPLRERAKRVVQAVRPGARSVTVADDEAVVGGGSLSTVTVASVAVVVSCRDDREAVRLARTLRMGSTSVFARVRHHEVRVNMMSILDGEDDELATSLNLALVTLT